MPISKKDVKYIAGLARIELTEQEEEKFEKELSSILGFIDKLNEVETKNTEPMAGGGELLNKTRGDSLLDDSLEGKSAELIKQVPEKKENWVKVKQVFE